MEVEESSRSLLKGTQNRGQRLVIHFSYGGQYLKKGDEIIWCAREDIHHALLMRNSDEELTYEVLVEKICGKIGPAEARGELKLSYFPIGVEPRRPVYIVNTIDFLCYLEPFEGKRNGVVNVEMKTNIQREFRSSFASNDNMVSSSRVNNGESYGGQPSEMLPLVTHEEEYEAIENIEHIEEGFVQYDDVGVRDTRQFVEGGQNSNVEWDDGMDVHVGQEFGKKEDVIELIQKASHMNCFNFDISKSDKWRYVVTCSQAKVGCKWYLRASRIKDSVMFSIRTYHKYHTCSRLASTSMMSRRRGLTRLVTSVVHEQYPGKFETPPANGLIGVVQAKYGVTVSYSTALRGKKQAIADVRGNPEDSYKDLYSYLHMLEFTNPDTVSYVEVDEDRKFKYLFFALGACVEGFKVMRKVIIVDGTFIKSKYGGVLLIATAQDPNHHHYPLAFGVVDGEKDESCSWFFEKLKTVIPDFPGLVFLSDRSPSFIKTIREVYPLSHHGYCIYHLSQNVKMHVSNTNKERVAKKFREMAHVYTQGEFDILYDDFKNRYPSAAEYLERSCTVDKWARCFFPGERYNMDTTNCAESLNSVFKEARNYSLLPMIDAIVTKIAEWFNKHRMSSSEANKLVPYVENVLHESCFEAKQLGVFVLHSFLLQFNVMGRDGRGYFVDLRMRTCTCKRFDIDHYPCVHAIAALIEARRKSYTDLEVHDFCSEFYWMCYWKMAYYKTIHLVPHMAHWKVPADVRSMCVNPPNIPQRRGRRQVNRYPSMVESRQRRNTVSMYDEFH